MNLSEVKHRIIKKHKSIDKEYESITTFIFLAIIIVQEYGWIYFITPVFIVGTIKFILKRIIERQEYRKEE